MSVQTAQPGPRLGRFPIWTLTRFRALQVRNMIDQQLRDSPARAFAVLLVLAVVWGALYLLLSRVLQQVGRWELVALVAKQYIFVHFFLVLAVMLAFSNAVLAFGSLFGRQEASHLLAMPVPARHVVCIKWIEGMVLSSWSFMLLGVPLMLAVAHNTRVEWFYYPLFVGHFLGFVIIPSTLGLLAAWAVAMWIPRRPLLGLAWVFGALTVLVVAWAWRTARSPEFSERWLQALYFQLNLAKLPLLPSTWTAKGIVAAMEKRVELSLLYLGASLANGVFFAWLTVNIVGSSWGKAFSRARQGRARALIQHGWFTEMLCSALFFYLPGRMRMLMLKDLRSFARDATQWLQMVIMLGLLMLYAMNLNRLPIDLDNAGMRVLLAFLNLAIVCLILATFTSRFVFPLLSLELQQLWLLGLLPMNRFAILLVKFVFSVTVTGLSGLVVVGLSTKALALPAEWVGLQVALCLTVCVGLSGLAVGLGARFPVRGERNPAKIASGFGGTLNLVASMLFVSAEMAGLAVAGVSRFGTNLPAIEEVSLTGWMVPLLIGLGLAVGAIGLLIGGRYFSHLEY